MILFRWFWEGPCERAVRGVEAWVTGQCSNDVGAVRDGVVSVHSGECAAHHDDLSVRNAHGRDHSWGGCPPVGDRFVFHRVDHIHRQCHCPPGQDSCAVFLCWLVRHRRAHAHERHAALFKIAHALGPWSMIDVCVVCVLAALVQIGDVLRIRPDRQVWRLRGLCWPPWWRPKPLMPVRSGMP